MLIPLKSKSEFTWSSRHSNINSTSTNCILYLIKRYSKAAEYIVLFYSHRSGLQSISICSLIFTIIFMLGFEVLFLHIITIPTFYMWQRKFKNKWSLVLLYCNLHRFITQNLSFQWTLNMLKCQKGKNLFPIQSTGEMHSQVTVYKYD